MTFKEIERQLLNDMITRRDLLSKAIKRLEFELANPALPIDWEKVNKDVAAEVEWAKIHMPYLFEERGVI